MNIQEILSDAFSYPFNNVRALLLYVILGIISGIASGGALLGIATGQAINNAWLTGGAGIIGVIITIILTLLITGYELDIVKYGIRRDSGAPDIDLVRQVVNAIKLIIVSIVYYLIPIIIFAVLQIFLKNWFSVLIFVILLIIFAFAQFMAKCRLAKTESLGSALAIGDAIGDISRVGIINLLGVIVVSAIVFGIVFAVISFIASLNAIIGGILIGIFGIYTVFFINRATGLLYSNA